VLAALKPLEQRFFRRPLALAVVIEPATQSIAALRATAEDTGLRVERLAVRAGRSGRAQVRMSLGERTPERDTEVVDRLRALPGVRTVTLRAPG
jgi:hypothetical protein